VDVRAAWEKATGLSAAEDRPAHGPELGRESPRPVVRRGCTAPTRSSHCSPRSAPDPERHSIRPPALVESGRSRWSCSTRTSQRPATAR
jgi:hypothetical protein